MVQCASTAWQAPRGRGRRLASGSLTGGWRAAGKSIRMCCVPRSGGHGWVRGRSCSVLGDGVEHLHAPLVLLHPHQKASHLLRGEHAPHVVHHLLRGPHVLHHLLPRLVHELVAVAQGLLQFLAPLAALLEALHLRRGHAQLVHEEVQELVARALVHDLVLVRARRGPHALAARLEGVPEGHLVLGPDVEEVEDLVEVVVHGILALALVLHKLLDQVVHVRCEPVNRVALEHVRHLLDLGVDGGLGPLPAGTSGAGTRAAVRARAAVPVALGRRARVLQRSDLCLELRHFQLQCGHVVLLAHAGDPRALGLLLQALLVLRRVPARRAPDAQGQLRHESRERAGVGAEAERVE
mmetsp:Transcript_19471/g.65346  ORF Transcript_19471/g.65346 Transcript_19471/m.65346 type:complete len:352 (+) Transcript_19471:490-1545(+)